MRYALASLTLLLTAATPASAEPVLKLINFTADWCPNCQILNPRLEKAVAAFEAGEVEIINLDMTHARWGTPDDLRVAALDNATALADDHQVRYLWEWYRGLTGLAAIVAADNGEPISCVMRPMTTKAIKKRLKQAKKRIEQNPPGARKPGGPDCPPPRNG